MIIRKSDRIKDKTTNNCHYKHDDEDNEENEISDQQTQRNYYSQHKSFDKQQYIQLSIKTEDDQRDTTVINRRRKKINFDNSRDYSQTQNQSFYQEKQLIQQLEENSDYQNEEEEVSESDRTDKDSDVCSEESSEIRNTKRQLHYSRSNQNNASMQKAKKMPWSDDEDRLVIQLVEQYGPQKWTFIAQHIPGRIGKQCRERWHNHLNPKINKEAWTDEEEWVLFLCHKLKGNKWAEITSFLPGRTDNAIKNHWNSSMKKRIQELYSRYLKIKSKQIDSKDYQITGQYKESEDTILSELFLLEGDVSDDYFIQSRQSKRRKSNIKLEQTPTSKYQIKSLFALMEKMPVDYQLLDELRNVLSEKLFEDEAEASNMIQAFKIQELEDILASSDEILQKFIDYIKPQDPSDKKVLMLPLKEKKKRGRKPKVMKDLSSDTKPIPEIKQESSYPHSRYSNNDYSFFTPKKMIRNNEGRMIKIGNHNIQFENQSKSSKFDEKMVQKMIKVEHESYPQPTSLQNIQNIHHMQHNMELLNEKASNQNNNNFFSSPNNIRYESPSQLLNLRTPEHNPIEKYLIGAHMSTGSKKNNNLFNNSAWRDHIIYRDTSPLMFQKFVSNHDSSDVKNKLSARFSDVKHY